MSERQPSDGDYDAEGTKAEDLALDGSEVGEPLRGRSFREAAEAPTLGNFPPK